MNKVIITFLFLIGITASSCTTSKSVVSQNVDLSKYEYASIINNDTYHIPAQLMEYEIQLFDIQTHYLNIINFFDRRATNAAAESFNAKIKAFRAQFRGVRDKAFFLYRLTKLYA